MAKIEVGDIFEIETPKGKGYLHYIHKKDSTHPEDVRVLQGLYNETPSDLNRIVQMPERYIIGFPLGAAWRRKIVKKAGHYPAVNFKYPKFMRSTHAVRGEFLGWHIVNTDTLHRTLVKELSPEQKKLSPWGIWNDTLLIEKLVEDWSLEKWSDNYKSL